MKRKKGIQERMEFLDVSFVDLGVELKNDFTLIKAWIQFNDTEMPKKIEEEIHAYLDKVEMRLVLNHATEHEGAPLASCFSSPSKFIIELTFKEYDLLSNVIQCVIDETADHTDRAMLEIFKEKKLGL